CSSDLLWSGPPRVRMSSLAMPAAVKLRRPRRTYFRALAAQIAPELCKPVSLEETRAQGKPGARCTRSLARKTKSARASSPQVHRNSPAFPAQWFYGLYRALLGDEFVLSPSSAD